MFSKILCLLCVLAFITSACSGESPQLIVGDSWAYYSPESGDKIARCNGSIAKIIRAVEMTPSKHYETVVIIAGIADIYRTVGPNDSAKAFDIQIAVTRKRLGSLESECRRKFTPDTIIVYDPQAMIDILREPVFEGVLTKDLHHLTDFGYEHFLIEQNQVKRNED